MKILHLIVDLILQKYLQLILLTLTFSIMGIVFVLNEESKYQAKALFEYDINWSSWWNFNPTPNESYFYNLNSYVIGSTSSSNFIKKMSNFDVCNISKLNNEKQFIRNITIGKNRETNIFEITLLESSKLCAEKVLKEFLFHIEETIVSNEIKSKISQRAYLEKLVLNSKENMPKEYKIFFVNQLKKLNEELILINNQIMSPLVIISEPASRRFRFYPERSKTVILFAFLGGFLFLLIFMPSAKDQR